MSSEQPFQLFNTLSGNKERLEAIDPKHLKIYACGPTVYNYAHIGNARMAVVFDTLVRTLRVIYPKVTYVSNITDIDDKIIEAAKEQNVEITSITEKYTKIYNDDMLKLNVLAPDIQPKATEYIPEMIELIVELIEKDFAYEKEGHVLFHVPTYQNYGKLSKRNRDEQIAGSRVEVAPFKKDPADFVLWKPSTNEQPGWESPWGIGRPGWHTECSAMSKKTLGLPFDIHGGGRDLIFPHHENEIAQSCCTSASIDEPDSYAKYWMHNGFVTINGEKMAKSLGNIILVKDLAENYHGEVIRLALLSSHYRQGLDWNEKVIHQANKLINKLYEIKDDLDNVTISDNNETNLGPSELGQYGFQNSIIVNNSLMSVSNDLIPIEFNLYQNHPNPFNPLTKLNYDIPKASYVSLTIYDMLGNVVNNLVNAKQTSGYKSVQWDATNNQGQPVSAGVYFYSIEAENFTQTKKMMLVK